MPYYYATHNTQLAVHSPRGALSGVSSISSVLQVIKLLRTAFTIVGISALVNGVSISSAGVSSASVSAPPGWKLTGLLPFRGSLGWNL